MAEDLTRYAAVFGRAATIDGTPVQGIFDQPYTRLFDGIASSEPSYRLPTAQAVDATAAQGSVLDLDGETYRVRSVQADGTGMTTLLLELQ